MLGFWSEGEQCNGTTAAAAAAMNADAAAQRISVPKIWQDAGLGYGCMFDLTANVFLHEFCTTPCISHLTAMYLLSHSRDQLQALARPLDACRPTTHTIVVHITTDTFAFKHLLTGHHRHLKGIRWQQAELLGPSATSFKP